MKLAQPGMHMLGARPLMCPPKIVRTCLHRCGGALLLPPRLPPRDIDFNKSVRACSSIALAEASWDQQEEDERDDVAWLRARPPFAFLPMEVVSALALVAKPKPVTDGARVTAASGTLLIVRHGSLIPALKTASGDGGSPVAELFPGQCLGLETMVTESLTGRMKTQSGLLGLGLAEQPTTEWIVGPGTQLWEVPHEAASLLVRAYLPEFSSALTRTMQQAMEQSRQAIKVQALQKKILGPYVVAAPQKGVVGSSKYAARLRTQILAAARDPARRPVLVFGEPGTGKVNVAALVHFGSPARGSPLVRVSCDRLDTAGSELFGRGRKQGILGVLKEGGGQPTLLLDNVHKAPVTLLPALRQLLLEGKWRAAVSGGAVVGAAPQPLHAAPNVRMVLTAERVLPQLEGCTSVIKVAPLRVRSSDVPALAGYFLGRASRAHQPVSTELTRGGEDTGGPRPVHWALSAATQRRLQAYGWPGNDTELEGVLEQAAVQQAATSAAAPGQLLGSPAADGATAQGPDPEAVVEGTMRSAPRVELQQLPEELVWVKGSQVLEKIRLDLLEVVPGLRKALRGQTWPHLINFKFTAYVYPIAVALLLWGPQTRELNPVLNVFWDWWWPLIFVVYPFLGRIWCAVCPFMIYGELVQQWRLKSGAVLAKWPRSTMEKVGPWSLLGLFTAILVWEEVWDLPHSAALSGWLLILITVGAMVFSALFERRLWCRYVCPIGGMNALFAKASMTEVRAQQGVCSGSCTTYNCYKGGPVTPPDGLEAVGCPLYSHPAQLVDNANCTLCGECLRACPHKSVQWNLRPLLADLWEAGGHQASYPELLLLALLGGAVPLHSAGAAMGWLGGADAGDLVQGVNISHGLIALAALAAPALGVMVADQGARVWSRAAGQPTPAPLLQLGYGYLPLVWAATLAHYEHNFMAEGGKVLQVAVAMLDTWLPWAEPWLPPAAAPALVAHPAVIAFVQGGTLLIGTGASLALLRRVGAAPWVSLWPHALCMGVYMAEVWALNVQLISG